MSIIKPNRTLILKEAALRALNQGELAPGLPYKSSQLGILEGFYRHIDQTSDPFEQRHSYADAATGVGKQGAIVMIARHAHRIAQERGIGDVFKTFIGEPSVPMLKQTRKEFLKFAPEVSNSIGIYGGDSRDLSNPITIITHDSRQALIESGQLTTDDIDLSIDDEAHMGSLSVRRQNIINQVLTDTYHVGFSASTEYDTEKTMQQTHRNRFYHLSLRDAVEAGLLADYIQVQYAVVRMLPEEMKRRRGIETPNMDFTLLRRGEWSRMVTHQLREGVDGITKRPLHEKLGLFFAADTTHADNTAAMMNSDPVLKRIAQERGYTDVAVSMHTRDISTAVQERLLEEYEARKYMVGLCDKKLKVGYDFPAIKLGATFPGSSLVDAIQEAGRPVRHYINPITGESEGAVLLETILYVGYPDPVKDQIAKQNALKNITTIKSVLGGTVVVKQGYKRSENDNGGPKIHKGPQTLSPGSTFELFTTEEETLTISRQIDAASIQKPQLTEDVLRNYIEATYEKTGRWLATTSDVVWQRLLGGELAIAEGENGSAINNAIMQRLRGAINPDGSRLAASLADFITGRGYREGKVLLTEDVLKNYIEATYEKTGKWLSEKSDIVWRRLPDNRLIIVEGETGSTIGGAIKNGHRGAMNGDGSKLAASLADFIISRGYRGEKAQLTEDVIRNYIEATYEKTGKWLSGKSKTVWRRLPNNALTVVEGETGQAIHLAIESGYRGAINPDGSKLAASLADFITSRGYKEEKVQLTEDVIRNYIEATYEKTGEWLSENNKIIWQRLSGGKLAVVEGITGMAINHAIRKGLRGAVNLDGSKLAASLPDFINSRGYRDEKSPLTEDVLKNYIEATYEKTGKWLTKTSYIVWQRLPDGKFAVAEGVTGGVINHAIREGHRGAINPDGSKLAESLPDFIISRGYRDEKDQLTQDILKNYIEATYEKTGEWLNQRTLVVWRRLPNGDLTVVESQSGKAIDHAIRNRKRGAINADRSPLAKSLADFRQINGFVGDKLKHLVSASSSNETDALDIKQLARQAARDVFAELPDNFIDRLADAVVRKLQGTALAPNANPAALPVAEAAAETIKRKKTTEPVVVTNDDIAPLVTQLLEAAPPRKP